MTFSKNKHYKNNAETRKSSFRGAETTLFKKIFDQFSFTRAFDDNFKERSEESLTKMTKEYLEELKFQKEQMQLLKREREIKQKRIDLIRHKEREFSVIDQDSELECVKRSRGRFKYHEYELSRRELALAKERHRVYKKAAKNKRKLLLLEVNAECPQSIDTIVENSMFSFEGFDISFLKSLNEGFMKIFPKLTEDCFPMLVSLLNLICVYMRTKDPIVRQMSVSMLISTFKPMNIRVRFISVLLSTLGGYTSYVLADDENTIVPNASILDSITDIASTLDKTLHADFVRVLRQLFVGITAYCCFPRELSQKVFDLIGTTAEKMSGIRLIQVIFDVISKIGRASALFLWGDSSGRRVPLSEILFACTTFSEFKFTYQKLKMYKDYTYAGLPKEGFMCQFHYLRTCETFVTSVTAYISQIGAHTAEYGILKGWKLEVTQWKNDLSKNIQSAQRIPAFAVAITGGPGCGKSLTMPLVASRIAAIKGYKFEMNQVYFKNKDDEFWDGYDSLSHNVVFMSEVGSTHRNIVKTTGDPALSMFLSACDTAPFNLNMAQLEKKSKSPFLAELFIMDGNDDKFNLDVCYNNPAAFWRRIFHIVQSVKFEYRKSPDSTEVDKSKVAKAIEEGKIENEYDVILYDVILYSASGNENRSSITALKNGNYKDLVHLFDKMFIAHQVSNSRTNQNVLSVIRNIPCTYVTEDAKSSPLEMVHTMKPPESEDQKLSTDGVVGGDRRPDLGPPVGVYLTSKAKSLVSYFRKRFKEIEFDGFQDRLYNMTSEFKLTVNKAFLGLGEISYDYSTMAPVSPVAYVDENLKSMFLPSSKDSRLVADAPFVSGLSRQYAKLKNAWENYRSTIDFDTKFDSDVSPAFEKFMALSIDTKYSVGARMSFLNDAIQYAQADLDSMDRIETAMSEIVVELDAINGFDKLPIVTEFDAIVQNSDDGKENDDHLKAQRTTFIVDDVNECTSDMKESNTTDGSRVDSIKAEIQSVGAMREKFNKMKSRFMSKKERLSRWIQSPWEIPPQNMEKDVVEDTRGFTRFYTDVIVEICVLTTLSIKTWLYTTGFNFLPAPLAAVFVRLFLTTERSAIKMRWTSLAETVSCRWKGGKPVISTDVLLCSNLRNKYMVLGAVIFSALGGIALLVAKLRSIKKSVEPNAELTPVVRDMENTIGAREPYSRIKPVHDPFQWNVLQTVHPSYPFTQLKEDFITYLKGQTLSVFYEHDGNRYRSHVFGVKGHYALINSHYHNAAVKVGATIKISLIEDPSVISGTVTIDPSGYFEMGCDLTLVMCSRKFSDTTKHIAVSHVANAECTIGGSDVYCDYVNLPLNCGSIKLKEYYMYNGYKGFGLCGNVLGCQIGKAWAIIGFHCAGDLVGTKGYSVVLRREIVLNAIAMLDQRCGLIALNSSNGESKHMHSLREGVVNKKSPFANIHLSNVDYYGTVAKSMPNRSSDVVPNVFKPHVPQLETITNLKQEKFFTSPLMQPQKKPVYLSPQNNALSHFTHEIVMNKITEVKDAVEYLIPRLIQRIDKECPGLRLAPYDVLSSINGSPVDAYLRRINASTAAGFIFKGKKCDHIPLDSPDDVIRTPTPEVQARIIEIFEAYEKGLMSDNIFTVSLKDEPVTTKKRESGITRLFYVHDIAHLIVSRMVLGPIVTLIQQTDAFCSMVGINMGTQAEKVFSILSHHPNYIESDAEKFDIKAAFLARHGTFTIVHEILRHYGYNDQALSVCRGVLSDLLNPTYCLDGDLFSKSSVPSGHYGTAELNCLIILIMMVITFRRSQREGLIDSDLEFFDHVALAAYGDDQGSSASDRVAKGINNVKLADMYAEYNMKLTSSDKSSELTEFVDITKATFLKRTFRWSAYLNMRVAPLDHNSIYKMSSVSVKSTSATWIDQMVSIANSALGEWFLYSVLEPDPESHFERIREVYLNALVEGFPGVEFSTKLFSFAKVHSIYVPVQNFH